MMRVDGRRLVRASGVALALFLLVGGGVGFAMAADGEDGLTVPAPRPGDKVVYSAQRIWLDANLARGGTGDIQLDQVSYQWLPEERVMDGAFADRLARPLQAHYTYLAGTPREVTYDRIVYYDAADGRVLFQRYDTRTTGTVGGPTVWTNDLPVLGNVVVGTEFESLFVADQYHFSRSPCAVGLTPLHGRPYAGDDVVLQGRCGWQDEENQILYEGQGWDDTQAGRAYRFSAKQDGKLQAWFDGRSPFPVQLTTSSAEITDPAWAVGRLFRLTLTSFTAGTGSYSEVDADALPPAPGALPAVPRTAWMLDDAGMDKHMPLTLQQAYLTALAASGPRAPNAMPHLADWLRQHPDGYLAAAWALEYHDDQGETLPQWILLWVDGDAWLGKRVSWEAASQQLVLPAALGRHGEVTDWTPSWLPADVDAMFPDAHQLPATLPRPADLVQPYFQSFGADAVLNRYGFQLFCRDTACDEPGVLVEVGRHQESQAAAGSQRDLTETREAFVDKLMVDGNGEPEYRMRSVEATEAILPLSSDGGASPPAGDSAGGGSPVWVAPVSPRAATGVGLIAILAGILYYFWPAVKGALGAGLFSRIQDEAVLEHPVRRAIADALDAEPGIHFLALSRKVGAGRSALEHHLRKMEAAGLVSKQRASGFTCYFPKGRVDRHLMAAAPALRTDGSRAILQAIAANPGATSRRLAAVLGVAPSTVSYHLRRLEQAGLVAPGNRSAVHLTALGSQASATAAA